MNAVDTNVFVYALRRGCSVSQPEKSHLYVVRDGPMKGGFVSIVSIDEPAEQIRAVVSTDDWVTPRVTFNWSQLEVVPHRLALLDWLWSGSMIIFVLLTALTESMIGPVGVATVMALAAMRIAWIKWLCLRRRTCPMCGGRLDLATWSHCDTCGWDRPMPILPWK